jgi:hypothetical protein
MLPALFSDKVELMLRSVETRCGLLVEEEDMVNCVVVVVAEFRAIQQNVTKGTETMD